MPSGIADDGLTAERLREVRDPPVQLQFTSSKVEKRSPGRCFNLNNYIFLYQETKKSND